MKIERVEQYYLKMPLKHHFETSFGRETHIHKIVLAVHSDGLVGWGESPVEELPHYSYETVETAWHSQRDELIPTLLASEIERGADAPELFKRTRGHNMAKAGLEAALWDLEARRKGVSLRELVGAARDRLPVGVSIGVQDTVPELLEQIGNFIGEGYQKIKVKIKPGWDADVIGAIRAEYPDVPLMADANSAYSLGDAAMLRALDDYHLLMIEQPLAYDDILDHAILQAQLETPVCLDESITTVRRAQEALQLAACRIINIKPARVGGISAAIAIHDLAAANDTPVWCGGLLESGVGRAANLAVAALPNFTIPGDISASDRYWEQDIVEPAFVLNDDGTMTVPDGPGIGVEVVRYQLGRYAERTAVYQ
jgi:O-succinylbenzoate synthase